MKKTNGKNNGRDPFFSYNVRVGFLLNIIASTILVALAYPIAGNLIAQNSFLLNHDALGVASLGLFCSAIVLLMWLLYEMKISVLGSFAGAAFYTSLIILMASIASRFAVIQFPRLGLLMIMLLLIFYGRLVKLLYSISGSWLFVFLCAFAAPLFFLIGGAGELSGILNLFAMSHLIPATAGDYLTGYALLFFLFAALAAWWFPMHRRVREYFRPRRLPRLRAHRSGMTLIELLIVVLILAIFSAGVAQMSSVAQRAMERRRNWELALDLAENELVLLRAMSTLPAPGEYPIAPELAARYDFADQAKVEISEGPHEAVREVRVIVRLRANADERLVELARLLPVTAEKGEGR
jgi:prepilin-type N-terminal cleavage/methylation domain-containing protein